MKSIWTLIAILAVAHLLTLIGFVGYLAGTDRMSRERLESVRDLFVMTVAEAKTAKEAEEAAAAASGAGASTNVLNRLDGGGEMPGSGSANRIDRLKTNDELMREREMRLEKDRDILKKSLESENRKLQAKRDELGRQEAAFDAKIEAQKLLREDEQFQKMVSVLKGLPAKDMKAKFDAFIAEGKIDLVVDVLDAFDARTAQKVLKEYKTPEENVLAAELLVRLKDRGLTATNP